MKKVMLGMLIGMVSATALCTCGNSKSARRTRRAIANKVEDLLN